MTEWRLYDFSARLPAEAGEAPAALIRTEEQLREELARRRESRPAMIALVGPDGQRLDVGLGGPWSGVQWTTPPYSRNLKVALASETRPGEGIDFACEGSRSGFRPEHLIPADQAVEIVVVFFRHDRPPEGTAWAEWDATKRSIATAPPNGPTPQEPGAVSPPAGRAS